MQFLQSVYLLISLYISLTYSAPFWVKGGTKSIVKHYSLPLVRTGRTLTTIRRLPSLPMNSHFQRRKAVTPKPIPIPQSFYDSSNKFENMFSGDQYIEQRHITDLPIDDSSDLHPIYVLPPPNFQPIVYPISRSDGVAPEAKFNGHEGIVLKRQIPYTFPHGMSSWIFGGLYGTQRGNYWERLGSDLALHKPVVKNISNKPVVIYLKKTPEQLDQPKWMMSFPTYEAHSVVKETTDVPTNTIKNIINKNKINSDKNNNGINDNNVLKTKLPVGLTSFFLGGMRGVSGRHWQMPSTLVSSVEFMPNDSKPVVGKPIKQKKPIVYFNDDNDFYNYNVIKVDK